MSLQLVHSESAEEQQNRAVWEEIDRRVEARYAAWAERVKQEALVPFVEAYEARLRKLEAQVPALQVVQGQQLVIEMLTKILEKGNT